MAEEVGTGGLSLVIISFQEAANIERCIQSVGELADEIVVVDSGSTDETRALAAALGARVLERPFTGYRDQKLWAIEQASQEWVLSLDADEALGADLRESIKKAKDNWAYDGYYLNRLNRLKDRWIRHGAWYPDRKYRLFRRGAVEMPPAIIHEGFRPTASARVGRLSGDILHYTNDSLESRVATQHKFSKLAAQDLLAKGKRGSLWRLWWKPKGRFLAEYIWKGGWRDGFYGYYIAKTSSQYVFWREAKLLELSRAATTK